MMSSVHEDVLPHSYSLEEMSAHNYVLSELYREIPALLDIANELRKKNKFFAVADVLAAFVQQSKTLSLAERANFAAKLLALRTSLPEPLGELVRVVGDRVSGVDLVKGLQLLHDTERVVPVSPGEAIIRVKFGSGSVDVGTLAFEIVYAAVVDFLNFHAAASCPPASLMVEGEGAGAGVQYAPHVPGVTAASAQAGMLCSQFLSNYSAAFPALAPVMPSHVGLLRRSMHVPASSAAAAGGAGAASGTGAASQAAKKARLDDLPARPVPIAFEPAGFNDSTGSPMYVVTLDDGYPFYLEQRALEQVTDWATGEVSAGYATQKLLLLTGPIKCGKTTLLKLLSRLLAPDSGRKPVVLFHSFTVRQGPHDAALELVKAAQGLAEEQNVKISALPTTREAALADVSRVMGKLAEGIAAAGGELILLLDEAQAPIIAAEAPADANLFAAKLKAIHNECRATSRIAITGSGMVSLLNCLRSLPPNGYALWGAMARVRLGATPAPAAGRTMAEAIIAARSHAWPQAVKELFTPDFVLSKLSLLLTAGGAASAADAAVPLTAARPALVAFLAELLGTAAVGDADAVAEAALSELSLMITEEANVDAAVALASLEEGQRKTVYCLAAGMLDRTALETRLGGSERLRFTQLLDTLCEPSSDPDATLTLLPPYSALFTKILDADGALLVAWTGSRWELREELRDCLKFFGEHYAHLIQHQRPVAEAVSAAVLQAMADNGHGIATCVSSFLPVATLAEMESLPIFHAIRTVLNDQEALKATSGGAKLSQSMATFGKQAAAAADPTSTADELATADRYKSVMGLHLLVWLHRIEAHAYISKEVLISAKLTGSVLEHWMRSALRAWQAQGFPVSDKRVPVLPPTAGAAAASSPAAAP